MSRDSQSSIRTNVLPLVLWALGSAALFSGCGPSEEVRVANKGDIRDIMNLVSNADEDPDAVAQFFVEGAAPNAEWFEFTKGKVIEVDDVALGENEAKVTFTVETYTGDIEADCEWKFVNQDGQWLISEAPASVP